MNGIFKRCFIPTFWTGEIFFIKQTYIPGNMQKKTNCEPLFHFYCLFSSRKKSIFLFPKFFHSFLSIFNSSSMLYHFRKKLRRTRNFIAKSPDMLLLQIDNILRKWYHVVEYIWDCTQLHNSRRRSFKFWISSYIHVMLYATNTDINEIRDP